MKRMLLAVCVAAFFAGDIEAKIKPSAGNFDVGLSYTTQSFNGTDTSGFGIEYGYGFSENGVLRVGYSALTKETDGSADTDVTELEVGVDYFYPWKSFTLAAGLAYGTGSLDNGSDTDFTKTSLVGAVYYDTTTEYTPFLKVKRTSEDRDGSSAEGDTDVYVGVIYDINKDWAGKLSWEYDEEKVLLSLFYYL